MAKTAATPKVETPAGRDGEKAKNKPKPTRKRRPKRQRENKQTDDREHEPNANDDAGTPPPSRRRGRPAAPEDVSKDVIYAKGAAAQTMTNPGNLLYYRLCDERFEEWSALKSNDRQRGVICREIVDTFLATGGVFRNREGGVLDRAVAATKTKDRLRQIAKPKLRPTGFGEDDVVFCPGAANFLYPGNLKFKKHCESLVLSYWKDLSAENSRRHTRPPHQVKIIEDCIAFIEDKGAKFRDPNLNVLSRKEIVDKIASRFRDLKKSLNNANKAAAGQRTGGFTSVKSVVTEKKRKAKAKKGGEEKNKGGGGPDGAYQAFMAQYSWNSALADAADAHGKGEGGHAIMGRHMGAMREELEGVCGADLCAELTAARSKKRKSTKQKPAKRKRAPPAPKVEALQTQEV